MNPKAINTQLYNAVANIAQKQDQVRWKKEQLDQANYRYTEAVEALNTAQMEFEELVNEVKNNPAADTIWHRDIKSKTKAVQGQSITVNNLPDGAKTLTIHNISDSILNRNSDCRFNPNACPHNLKFGANKPEGPPLQVLKAAQNPPIPQFPKPTE